MLAESVHSVADTGNAGAAARSAAAAPTGPASDDHPFGFGRGAVLSTGSWCRSCCSPSARPSPCTTASTRSSRPEAIHDSLISLHRARLVRGAGGVLAAHRHPRGEQGARRPQLGRLHPPGPKSPVPAGGPARGPAPRLDRADVRVRRGQALSAVHRQRPVGRRRLGSPSACCSRRPPPSWPIEMKSLLIGEAAGSDVQRRIVAAPRGRPRARPGHPPAAPSSISPDCRPGRRQGRRPRHRAPPRKPRRPSSTAERPRPRRRPHRQDHLPGAGRLPPGRRRREPTLDPDPRRHGAADSARPHDSGPMKPSNPENPAPAIGTPAPAEPGDHG